MKVNFVICEFNVVHDAPMILFQIQRIWTGGKLKSTAMYADILCKLKNVLTTIFFKLAVSLKLCCNYLHYMNGGI